MHANVPLPHLASGWAVLIVAALGLRVHRWPPLDAFLLSQANHVPQDARGTRFFQTMRHSPRLTVAVPAAIGVEELMFNFQLGPVAHAEVMESIRLFGKQVIPYFRT